MDRLAPVSNFGVVRQRLSSQQRAAPEMSGLSHGEWQELVVKLLGDVAELDRIVDEQRKEIARLKCLKGKGRTAHCPREAGNTAPHQTGPKATFAATSSSARS